MNYIMHCSLSYKIVANFYKILSDKGRNAITFSGLLTQLQLDETLIEQTRRNICSYYCNCDCAKARRKHQTAEKDSPEFDEFRKNI